MKLFSTLGVILFGVLVSLTVSGCSENGNDNGARETLVTIRGRVDDGTAASPIANAQCRFVDRNGSLLATATADASGEFHIEAPPEVQGFIGCNPPGFPNLILITFVSTVGIAGGETLPAMGREEVSPPTTLIANIIAQTTPADPQARKVELLAALAARDPDITTLVGAATDLFNALHQRQITDVDFSAGSGEESGESGGSGSGSSGGIGGGGDGAGVIGEAGDATEFSPLANAQCEFVLDLRGDTALEDYLRDGFIDQPELLAMAADVPQDARLKEAFARLFPHGMQRLVNGQPLRTTTNANGTYFLPVPPHTPGFVRCAAAPNLAISTFVKARQTGETLTDQNVSPASQIFAAFIIPQLTFQDVQAVENNFLADIGRLQVPAAGIVRLETVATPQGRVIADTNGDGLVCSLLINNPQQGSIAYVDAGATSYTAIALFKALLIEARNPASASYEAILADVLTRTDATGNPRVEVLAEDLLAGGVPGGRATELAARLNECIRFGVERVLGTSLPRMVRTGRFRVAVRDTAGASVPNVRVGGVGRITAASECQDAQGRIIPPLAREENLIVCGADENGRISFLLEGKVQLEPTPVEWSVRTANGALLGQVNAPFATTVTTDAVVTVPRQ